MITEPLILGQIQCTSLTMLRITTFQIPGLCISSGLINGLIGAWSFDVTVGILAFWKK